MKKNIKIMFISLLLFVVSTNVFGVTPMYPYKLRNGVGNMYYYVDGTAYNYVSLINNSANNWIYTGHGYNPIYIYPVSSNNGTTVDLYGHPDSDFDYDRSQFIVYADTSFFEYSTYEYPVSPYNQNWLFGKIRINVDKLKQPARTASQIQGTITHEMGHVFGLAHYNTNPNSIMCQSSSRVTQVVSAEDNEAINIKY